MSRAKSSSAQWERLRSEAFRAPWLSSEDERALLGAAQAGGRAALAKLCASHLRLVVQIAAQHQRSWVQPEDLVGEGAIGLLEAIDRFDLTQATRLSTYAGWWIRARIRAYVADSRTIVGLPATRGARVVRAQLANVERALTQALGRTPTHAEIAVALGVPEADVTDIALALATRPASIGDGLQSVDPSDPAPGPEAAVSDRERRRLLASRISSLDARDRMIVERHFLREEESLADLGAALGITRQRVSQIAQRLRRVLADELRSIAC